MKQTFVEQFAEHLTEWVPELEGRAVAVSESDPFTPETMPRLPLAIVAVVGETYEQFPTIETTFVVEVMLAPSRYTKESGGDSPFWAYYDYTVIRDRILAGIESMGGIDMLQLEIEADPMAVYLSFRLRRRSRWCAPVESDPCAPDLASGGIQITAKAIPRRFFVNSQPPEEADDAC